MACYKTNLKVIDLFKDFINMLKLDINKNILIKYIAS